MKPNKEVKNGYRVEGKGTGKILARFFASQVIFLLWFLIPDVTPGADDDSQCGLKTGSGATIIGDGFMVLDREIPAQVIPGNLRIISG